MLQYRSQTIVVVAVVRVVVVSVRDGTVRSRVVPAATTVHAVITRRATNRPFLC